MRVIVHKADLERFQQNLDAGAPLTPASGEWTLASAVAAAAVLQHELLLQILNSRGHFQSADASEHKEARAFLVRRELQAAIGYVTTMVNTALAQGFEQAFGDDLTDFDATVEGDAGVRIEHEINGEVKRFLYDPAQ